jgi:UDP-N-acetylglucosamine 1-carboxyvinyltransferase
MADLIVTGGRPLSGTVTPSANKNAVLPVLCASLLTDRPVTLLNAPDITDVRLLLEFFGSLGSRIEADFPAGRITLQHGPGLNDSGVRLPGGMRASVMLIPGLLRRFGRATIEADPKGCTLGAREIDPHIEVFQLFGATVTAGQDEAIAITAPCGLGAADHWLDYASVTTTENFILCALAAQGRSRLMNAACEPHVQELCAFLSRMGARIERDLAGALVVSGPSEGLDGVTYRFEADFHEIATFLALGAVTGGTVTVRNDAPERFGLIDRTFAKFGAEIAHDDGWSRVAPAPRLVVHAPFTAHVLQKVEAAPWPYLPADLLPIFIALGVCADGSVLFWNKVYEGALGWTSELAKFGAHAVLCDPHRVITYGRGRLSPAEVLSPYIIRVAIALLMVAATIEGRSTIRDADPIRRAHPRFVENLRGLGAQMEWSGGAGG